MTNILTKIGMIFAGAILAIASYGMITATTVDAKGKPGGQTIAAIAASNGNFDILVKALDECTGLAPLFDGNRQFTVFAPLDTAFTSIGITLDSVCETPDLAKILAYHVTPGVKTSKTVLNRSSMNMLNRQMAPVDSQNLTIAEKQIVDTDLRASNGVIHVLSGVMIP